MAIPTILAKLKQGFWPMMLVSRSMMLACLIQTLALRGDPQFCHVTQANWKLWPFANVISFAAVPLHLRVLYSNVVSVAWNAYLSLSANR
jgi:hypothetical protein